MVRKTYIFILYVQREDLFAEIVYLKTATSLVHTENPCQTDISALANMAFLYY